VAWNASATNGSVNGALMIRGNYAGSGTAAVAYNKAILDKIRYGYGSFVRVPGSWGTVAGQ